MEVKKRSVESNERRLLVTLTKEAKEKGGSRTRRNAGVYPACKG